MSAHVQAGWWAAIVADQPVMTAEQVLLVSFQGNADVDSGRS